MTLPLAFPSWLPWWVPVAILVPALLYGVVFLAMPFSLFGLRARLDILEARLDEIQGEIRALVLRLPEPDRAFDYEPPPRPRRDTIPRPPIPPAPIPPAPVAPRTLDEREPGFAAPHNEPVRRFAAADRPVSGGESARFGARHESGGRRAPPEPPAPPPRRTEPRIDWPRQPS